MPATKRLNPQLDTIKFGQMLDASIESLDKIPGLYYQRFDLDHDAKAESTESLSSFKTAVAQGPPHGGQWDAHFIGAGLKLIPSLTPLFEDIVNTVVEEGKGKAKVLFSSNAADHAEVVKRGLPELAAQ